MDPDDARDFGLVEVISSEMEGLWSREARAGIWPEEVTTAGEVAVGDLEGVGVDKEAGGDGLGDGRFAVFGIGDFGGWRGGRKGEEGEKEKDDRWRREEGTHANRGTCHGFLQGRKGEEEEREQLQSEIGRWETAQICRARER